MNDVIALCESADRRTKLRDIMRQRGLVFTELRAGRGVNFEINFGHEPRLIIGAHHDVVKCGANDNTASVAILLELATLLRKERRGEDVRVVFFDNEELLCQGALNEMGSAFCAADLAKTVNEAIVLDVCGTGDTLVISSPRYTTRQPTPFESWLEKQRRAVRLPTPPSDDVSFLRYSVPVTLICTLPNNETPVNARRPTWEKLHTAADTPDTLDEKTMTTVVETLWSYVTHEGSDRARKV